MKKLFPSFMFIIALVLSCAKEKQAEPEIDSFIGTQYIGTYKSITNHPFGEPEPTHVTIDSFVTNVHVNDGYVTYFNDSVPLYDIRWEEDCFGSSSSSTYSRVRFTSKGDSMYYFRMDWFGPSGASSSKSFKGKKIE